MAVRGVYSKEEEKMLEDWKAVGPVWVGEEFEADAVYPMFSRVATKELIANTVKGQGSYNPLYLDDSYARNTRWGGIIAPPFFPNSLCWKEPSRILKVPRSVGETEEVPGGHRWEFYKPIHVGDSFRVRDDVFRTIEDTTSLDGNGLRTFWTTTGRKYINQNDEVVCTFIRRDTTVIIPPGMRGEKHPVLPLLKMEEYKYSKEELEFIDKMADEEEVRGADTRYWEDINIGDKINTTVTGPVTVWDQMLAYQGLIVANMREIRKKRPHSVFIDRDTGVAHHHIECHMVNKIVEMLGGSIPIVSRDMIRDSICRTITNWMGDDGFLRVFENRDASIIPIGDAFFCNGEVINKRVENGEHLVDLKIWAEDIRNYVSMIATATVSLYSKNES